MRKILALLSLMFACFVLIFPVRADELDDVNNELAKLQRDLNASLNATKPLESDLNRIRTQLANIKTRLTTIENDIEQKEVQITKAEKVLVKQKEIIDQRINAHYKNIKKAEGSMLDLIVAENLSNSLQLFFYQKKAADNDKEAILRTVLYIKNIDDLRDKLTSERAKLSEAKKQVDKQSDFLSGEITKAKVYQSELTGKIAALSARQQSILSARSGSFTVNIGDSELADDYNASIAGFRASAPGGYFAVFSFGAHTHRKGMSQYGARGRAQDNQDYKTILRAYYGKEPVGKDTGGTIKVAGYGDIDFETTYLYGIAEMPSSWHKEALKAQAVAARTYAIRYKQDGREICTTEACQVFNKSKSDSPPDSWRQAVDETKGQVLEDVVTFYASTHGGFASPIGWDTKDGSGGSSFTDKAYDKLGGSPWLYKAWYTKGYSVNSDKCGRSNPWLSPEEMADIVNAALVLTKSSDNAEVERITPVTTSCWSGNPYSINELRDVAAKYGGIASATSVSVSQGNGTTNTVTVNGVTLSGSDFKKAFNVRAPGYLSIPQSSFSFFNVERK
ncbi:MAG: Amidase enhancer precursor [Microgenomates bacterium OLB23]|nr:MAG: Amidase enhancer precursor [Microgenomates bacterium OLB23]